MDRVVANELPNAQMGACGVGHIPLLLLQSSPVWDHFYLMQELVLKLAKMQGPFYAKNHTFTMIKYSNALMVKRHIQSLAAAPLFTPCLSALF